MSSNISAGTSVRPVIATSYTPLSAPTDSVHNIQTPHHWDEVAGRQNNSPHFFVIGKCFVFVGRDKEVNGWKNTEGKIKSSIFEGLWHIP